VFSEFSVAETSPSLTKVVLKLTDVVLKTTKVVQPKTHFKPNLFGFVVARILSTSVSPGHSVAKIKNLNPVNPVYPV
jgi:hypothetical protein